MGSIGCWSLATEPVIIDARGLKCPLPVLKLEKQLAQAPDDATIAVLTTDPMARIDIPLYCRQNGYDCASDDADGAVRFTVTKAKPAL